MTPNRPILRRLLAAITCLAPILAACGGPVGAPTSIPTADVAAYVATQEAMLNNSDLPPWEMRNFGYGARTSLAVPDAPAILNGLTAMRFNWVLLNVQWAAVEPNRGDWQWTALDLALASIEGRDTGLRVMLTVSGAPDWARPPGADLTHDGPPADYALWSSFISALAGRYSGRVAAYELWPNANLRQGWDAPAGPSPNDYAALLQTGYLGIKSVDPMAIVVSGGLAPVGVGDGVDGVDDLAFLGGMYNAGAGQWFDVLGVHVDGRNNPPQDDPQANSTASTEYKGDKAYYFRHYEKVREVMLAAGDSAHSVWLTSAGWASAMPAPAGLEFAAQSTADQQAQYLTDAVGLARQQDYIGAIFIDNFNLAVAGGSPRDAAYSLIRTDWTARPAFLALARFRQADLLPLLSNGEVPVTTFMASSK